MWGGFYIPPKLTKKIVIKLLPDKELVRFKMVLVSDSDPNGTSCCPCAQHDSRAEAWACHVARDTIMYLGLPIPSSYQEEKEDDD